MSELFSVENAKPATRYSAIAALLLSLLVTLIPFGIWYALLSVGLICSICILIFQGTTQVTVLLQGTKRILFQVFMAVLAPCSLSLFFVQKATNFSVSSFWELVLNYNFLLVVFIMGLLSWGLGALLHREYPIRGLLIASVVVFVLTWFGYEDVPFGSDEYEDGYGDDFDESSHVGAVQGGKYFWQFLVYVAVAYVGLLANYFHRKLRPDSYLF